MNHMQDYIAGFEQGWVDAESAATHLPANFTDGDFPFKRGYMAGWGERQHADREAAKEGVL